MDPVVVSKINRVKLFQNLAVLRIANCTKRIFGKDLNYLSVQNNRLLTVYVCIWSEIYTKYLFAWLCTCFDINSDSINCSNVPSSNTECLKNTENSRLSNIISSSKRYLFVW